MNRPIDRRKFLLGLLASSASVTVVPVTGPIYDGYIGYWTGLSLGEEKWQLSS